MFFVTNSSYFVFDLTNATDWLNDYADWMHGSFFVKEK